MAGIWGISKIIKRGRGSEEEEKRKISYVHFGSTVIASGQGYRESEVSSSPSRCFRVFKASQMQSQRPLLVITHYTSVEEEEDRRYLNTDTTRLRWSELIFWEEIHQP